MKNDTENFINIIESTPLVSIDLVIRNESGQVLLGYRCNRPAKDYWFVPGGRIRKDERSQDALKRIAQMEAGIAAGRGQLLGVFDHMYDDNFYGIHGLSTHYVVLAYQFQISGNMPLTKDDQHEELKWWDIEALLASPNVHDNTKLYFRETTDNGFRCGNGLRTLLQAPLSAP